MNRCAQQLEGRRNQPSSAGTSFVRGARGDRLIPNPAYGRSEAAPTMVATTGFAHDFSRIPVYARRGGDAEAKRLNEPYSYPNQARLLDRFRGGLPSDEPRDVSSEGSENSPTPEQIEHTDSAPKLTKKQLGWTPLGCGSFKHDIRWELDKPTTKGGIIVQKVEWVYDVKNCDGTNFDMATLEWFKAYRAPYWEAWRVKKGQTLTTVTQRGVPMDDQFSAPSPGKTTKGSVLASGTPEFYDGLSMPSDFKVIPNSPAGGLPMTWTDPMLTGGSGTIPHSFGTDWDCCE